MNHQTKGRSMLVSLNMSLVEISNRCAVCRPTASRWRKGDRLPQARHRLVIEEALGIPFDAWDQPLSEGEVMPLIQSVAMGRPAHGSVRASKVAESVAARPTEDRLKEAHKATGGGSDDIPPYPPRPDHGSTLDKVRHSLSCIQHDLNHLHYTASARSKARQDETRTLALIAKLETAEELKEDRYVRSHPEWERVKYCILYALKPYPEAARAVLDALGRDEY